MEPEGRNDKGKNGEEWGMPGPQPAGQLCQWAAGRGEPAKEQLERKERKEDGMPTGPLKVRL